MAEQPNNNGGDGTPQNPANPNDGAQTPNKPEDGKGTQPFDTSKISDEQFKELAKDGRFWDNAFEHERFKKLNEKAKKADEYEANRAKEEEEQLKSQKKFEELANKKGEEAADWKGKFETSQANNRIIVEANKLGVIDTDAVLSLIDRSNIKVTDEGVEGVEDAVKALVEAKPYLVGDQKPAVPNMSGANPAGQGQNQPPKFKHSQILDPKFFQENEKDIMEAFRLGLIEDDIGTGVQMPVGGHTTPR